MPSPSQSPPADAPPASTHAHGLKRSRDMPPPAQQSASPPAELPAEPLLAPDDPPPTPLGHPPTPLAKKGRRLSKISNEEPANTPSNEGSEPGRSRLHTPEATEVKSVRKQVEGMGVENNQDLSRDQSEDETMNSSSQLLARPEDSPSNQPNDLTIELVSPDNDLLASTTPTDDQLSSTNPTPATIPKPDVDDHQSEKSKPDVDDNQKASPTKPKSDALPSCWAPYSTSASPFAAHAPATTASIFSEPEPKPPSAPPPPPSASPARAFASSPHKPLSSTRQAPQSFSPLGSLASASPNFPTSSDFFLKGKRNNWLGRSTTPESPDASSHHKKPKFPDDMGFGAYSSPKPTSLKPDTLAQLNQNPSLLPPSLTRPSFPNNLRRGESTATSVCAVNGDSSEDGRGLSLSPSSPAVPKLGSSTVLGFSAFAKSSAFSSGGSGGGIALNGASSSSSTSVFDQPQDHHLQSQTKTEQGGTGFGSGGGGVGGKKKTHLALAADLCEEDKHAGFGAKELITGEENERLIKSLRCKVFTLESDGSWHERGSGGLRLLCTKSEPFRYRLIMRADAVHRVLLNVPIFKGFNYVPSQDRFMSFAGTSTSSSIKDDLITNGEETSLSGSSGTTTTTNGQFQQYLCRFAKLEARQEMIDCITQCLEELKSRSSSSSSSSSEEE